MARALGQSWQPLRPTPPRERTAARPDGRAARERTPPPDVEVDEVVPGSLLLDVREPGELAQGAAVGARCIPMDAVPHALEELRGHGGPITVVCAAGARSFGVAHWLREQGLEAWSLAPGIGALRASSGWTVAPPPGPPGRRLRLGADTAVDGVRLGVAVDAELVELLPEGGARVVFRDAAGFCLTARVDAV